MKMGYINVNKFSLKATYHVELGPVSGILCRRKKAWPKVRVHQWEKIQQRSGQGLCYLSAAMRRRQ